MSKGGGDTQTAQSSPWAPQQPYLTQGFGHAQNVLSSGGPQFFPGSTYVPFSGATEQGLGLTEQRALGGSPVTGAAQNAAVQALGTAPDAAPVQNFVNQQLQPGNNLGQFSQFTGAAPGGLRGSQFNQAQQQAGVGGTPTLQNSQNVFQNQVTGLPSQTQNALAQTATGQSLGGNPYLDQQFNIASQRVTDTFNRDISPGIAAQFSLAGRTGSDAQADVQTKAAGEVSDSLAQLANSIYGGNYQQERDRQLNAAGQLGALSQAQQGLGLQAAGQGADFYNQGQGQDIARRNLAGQLGTSAGQQDIQRLGLAGDLFNRQQGNQLQAAGIGANVYGQQLGHQQAFGGLANSLANQDYADIDRLLGVGGRVENLGQRALNDRINRFDHYQNAPQNSLANYISAIQGNYGGVNTMSGGGPSRGQSALGGAASGAALGTSISPGWGTAIGALLGGVGGYAG